MDTKTGIIRLFAVIVLIIIGAFVPFWGLVIISVITAFFVKDFFELIGIGIVYDYIFHAPQTQWYMSFLHTLIFVGIVLIMSVLVRTIKEHRFRL